MSELRTQRLNPTWCAILLALLVRPVWGQSSDSVPSGRYFMGVDELYSGDTRNAQRIFRREANRSIKIGTRRWIDAIPCHAMLGEIYFRMGNPAEALAQFDQACQLFLQYPDWLLRVKFQVPPRPDPNSLRGPQPPWGKSDRPFTIGALPDTMMVFHGRQPSMEEIKRQRVTVVEIPQYFKLKVPEIIRATALAIRRRNTILGPLGKHDSISKELVDVLSRDNLSPPNHWSSSWIALQLGLAEIGVGRIQEAHTHLNRALLIDGRYDHPLTSVALLGQGHLALEAGNAPLAARLLAEASFSAFYFDNWNVVDEALRLGSENHLTSGGAGVFSPLNIAAGWAKRRGLRLLTTDFRIAQAENLAVLGELRAAEATLAEVTRWIGDMSKGRPGIRHLYLQALINYQKRQRNSADPLLRAAIERQMATSFRTFQLKRTDLLFDGTASGRITSRTAMVLYDQLLADPTDQQWTADPLDALALLSSPHSSSFDRWFIAALERKDILAAVDIAERCKRRRFLAQLPWGGRLTSLRNLLEDPDGQLPRAAALQRQQILASFPIYQELASAGLAIRRQLAQGPIVPDGLVDPGDLAHLYDQWDETAIERESLLREIGLQRIPAPILVPPLHPIATLQKKLAKGSVVVLFHVVRNQLHGFLITGNNYHHWQLGRAENLRKTIGELLRLLGNYGPGRNLATEDLVDDRWRNTAHQLYHQIFADSRLTLGPTDQLIIVPDGLLWYLPFEVLAPTALSENQQVLMDHALIRYAPTANLALADNHPLRRVRHTGIVATQSTPQEVADYVHDQIKRIENVVEGPVRLPAPLPQPAPLISALLDQVVCLDDIDFNHAEPSHWSPYPRDRRRRANTLHDLVTVPLGGPDLMVLPGFTTVAETGLKGGPRRGDPKQQIPGNDLFAATCHLMTTGARTVLLSRWRTGGQTNLQLVREFVQELPHIPPAEAWQRSVLLAREALLDPNHEPRLKRSEDIGQVQLADHPFFWAGYLLIDSGKNPSPEEDAGAQPEPVVRFKKKPE